MSVLDKATNDALNAIIDLHSAVGDPAVCAHCTTIAKSFAGEGEGDAYVLFPCPTVAALTGIAELLGVVQHINTATPEELIAGKPLGQLIEGQALTDGTVRDE